MAVLELADFSLERVFMSIEVVKDRCRRFAAAMDARGVPYAVIGGNAVALWVTRVEPAAERFTGDVDVLLRRQDIPRAAAAAAAHGFEHQQIGEEFLHVFRDSPQGKSPRQAFLDSVHVIFANEKVKATDTVAAPDVTEVEDSGPFRTIALEPLVRMKLVAHRLKDRVHLLDMIGVGLIDASWPAKFPAPLNERLQYLIDNPDA